MPTLITFLKENIDWIHSTLLVAIIVLGALVGIYRWLKPKFIKNPEKTENIVATLEKPVVLKSGLITFDYSTNDGLVILGEADCQFGIKFSSCSSDSIYIYSDHSSISKIARVKMSQAGDILDFNSYDSTSRSYKINLGELFIMQNNNGYFIQARVLKIANDSRGHEGDEVSFRYTINKTKNPRFKAI